MSEPHDGDARRGIIDAVITLGPQRGAGRIAAPQGGLVYFDAHEWLGAAPPKPGQRVTFLQRRNRATRVEPEPGAP